jgi:CHASE2 domain-containing sensor protein
MNESIKIAMIVLTPFLIGGTLVFLTWRNERRQLSILVPILIAVDIWVGFSHGWKTADFVQLGIILLLGSIGWFRVFRTSPKK